MTPERRSQRGGGGGCEVLSLSPVRLFWNNLPPLTSLSLLLSPSIYKGRGSLWLSVCAAAAVPVVS